MFVPRIGARVRELKGLRDTSNYSLSDSSDAFGVAVEHPIMERAQCAVRMVYKGRTQMVDAIESIVNSSAESKKGFSW